MDINSEVVTDIQQGKGNSGQCENHEIFNKRRHVFNSVDKMQNSKQGGKAYQDGESGQPLLGMVEQALYLCASIKDSILLCRRKQLSPAPMATQ